MNTRARFSLVTAIAALMAGVLIGAVTGSGEAGAATQRTLRIPAAAFEPVTGATTYYNYGSGLFHSGPGTAIAPFVAPVLFEGNTATVHTVKLHYYDNGPARICASLVRTYLKAATVKTMSSMCTRNAVDDARTRTDTTITPDTVGLDSAAYLFVDIPRGNYALYGVTIVYTSNP